MRARRADYGVIEGVIDLTEGSLARILGSPRPFNLRGGLIKIFPGLAVVHPRADQPVKLISQIRLRLDIFTEFGAARSILRGSDYRYGGLGTRRKFLHERDDAVYRNSLPARSVLARGTQPGCLIAEFRNVLPVELENRGALLRNSSGRDKEIQCRNVASEQ